MHTSTPLGRSVESSGAPRPPKSRSVYFALLCALAFASSLLSVEATADESPIAVALSALP